MSVVDRLVGWLDRLLGGPRASERARVGEGADTGPGEGADAGPGEGADAGPGEGADTGAPGPVGVVVMPIEDAIDLHTFAPRDVASVVEEYLHEARARGFREVRVIHGKGKGVQRRIVQGVLSRHPAVESFRDAPGTRGGWGATVVVLKGRR